MKQKRSNIKFETAKKIRELLDQARKEYGDIDWEDDGVEGEIIDMITNY